METFGIRRQDGIDIEGAVDLPSYHAAHREALKALAGMLLDAASDTNGADWQRFRVEVTDDRGVTLVCLEYGATESVVITGHF